VQFAWLAKGRTVAAIFKGDTAWDFVPGCYLAKQAGAVVGNFPGLNFATTNQEIADTIIKNCK
jgi:fructose-1,6-bisphosphatase/inositol monophosphatase family enzyme